MTFPKTHFKAKMSLTGGLQPLSMDKPSRNGYCTLVADWTETQLRNFSVVISLFTTLLFKTIKDEKSVIAALFSAQEMKPKNKPCTVNKK